MACVTCMFNKIRKTSPSKLLAPMKRVANPAQLKFVVNQMKVIQKWPKPKFNAYMADTQKVVMKYKSQLMRGKIPPGFKKAGAAIRRKYGLKTAPKNLM